MGVSAGYMAAMRPCAFVTPLLNCFQSLSFFCSRVTVTPAVGWPLCRSRMCTLKGLAAAMAMPDRLAKARVAVIFFR